MKSLFATALTTLALSFMLASNAPAQERTGLKTGEGTVDARPPEVLPVAEAKKRYLESQKQLDELAESDVKVTRHETDLEIAVVQISRDRLRAAVAEAYDARRQLQQSELAELERRIANIKRALAISDAMKETIIDQRTDELLDRIEQGDKSGQREGASRGHPGATDAAVALPPGSGSAKASTREVNEAEVALKEAEENLAAAKYAYDYVKEIYDKGGVFGSRGDVENKATNYERAKLELERAQEKLKLLGGATDGAAAPPPGSGSATASALDIIYAQIDVKAAAANLAAAKRAHDYSQKMHAKGFVTELDAESKASSYERAKLELERARLKLKSLGGTLPDDEPVSDTVLSDAIARDAEKNKRFAELDVEEAEADFAAAEREYRRVQAAHESGTVTQEAFDKAENKCRHAKIELERARLKLKALGEPASGDKPLVDDKSTSLDRSAEDQGEPRIVWGPTVGSIQLGWDVEPRKEAYHLGDVLTFGLVVRNPGDQAVQISLPRTDVLEKLGLDLTLRDSNGTDLSHFWGPAHAEKGELEVSGYNAFNFEPGGTHELGLIKLLVGRGKMVGRPGHDASIFATLDVTPGHPARLWFSLSPGRLFSFGEDAKLESEPLELRVEPRR